MKRSILLVLLLAITTGFVSAQVTAQADVAVFPQLGHPISVDSVAFSPTANRLFLQGIEIMFLYSGMLLQAVKSGHSRGIHIRCTP